MAGRSLPIDKVILAARWSYSGQPAKEICAALEIARSTLTSWKKTDVWKREVERIEKFNQPPTQDLLDIESRKNLLAFGAAVKPYRDRLTKALALQSELSIQMAELAAEAIAELEGSAMEKAQDASKKICYLAQTSGATARAAHDNFEKLWGIQRIIDHMDLENS